MLSVKVQHNTVLSQHNCVFVFSHKISQGSEILPEMRSNVFFLWCFKLRAKVLLSKFHFFNSDFQ